MEKNKILSIDFSKLNEQQKIKIIGTLETDKSAFEYLQSKLQCLSIEIGGDFKGNVMVLMNRGLLEGWCWQTTESSIVFLGDNDYIERGYLKFSSSKKYWHSWICFSFNNKIWVFDPCLQIIIEKELYYHIFEIFEIAGTASSKSVKNELLTNIHNHHNTKKDKDMDYFYKKFFPKYERKTNETYIAGNNDVESRVYRTNTGYTAIFNNGEIESLIAHYYYVD